MADFMNEIGELEDDENPFEWYYELEDDADEVYWNEMSFRRFSNISMWDNIEPTEFELFESQGF